MPCISRQDLDQPWPGHQLRTCPRGMQFARYERVQRAGYLTLWLLILEEILHRLTPRRFEPVLDLFRARGLPLTPFSKPCCLLLGPRGFTSFGSGS